jgi:hypothetical protein
MNMDANKLAKLIEIGYEVRQTCDTCENAELSEDGWGVCKVHKYIHIKHGDEREMSIHRTGHCPIYSADMKIIGKMHGFVSLIKEG